MFAVATWGVALFLSAVLLIGWVVYVVDQRLQQAQPQGGRRRARARPQPQALLRRRAARGPPAGAGAALRPAHAGRHRHRPAALLAVRAQPPGRRSGEGLGPAGQVGLRAVRHHRRGRLQLRRLPRRHEGHRRRRAVHHHRQDDRRGAGRHLERSGAEHGALPLQRGRGPLHPRVRPPVLAHVPLGHRRRRPDERPADRFDHRLPEDDPAAGGEVPQRRQPLRGRHPAQAEAGRDPEGHRRRAGATGAPRARARPSST